MARRKLSFSEVLSQSFRFFFDNLSLFFHLVTIPWIISLLLRVGFGFLDADIRIVALAEKVLDLVPSVMFLTAWMRATLLGPAGVDRLPGRGWSSRETAFLVYLVQIAIVAFVLQACFIFVSEPIDLAELNRVPMDPDVERRAELIVSIGTAFFVAALLALRVSFGLAASALDLPLAPRHAWTLSRGNGWAVIGIMFVVFFTSAVATIVAHLAAIALVGGVLGAGIAAAVVDWTVMVLVSYAGAALGATAQAVIFRELTGWQPGRRSGP